MTDEMFRHLMVVSNDHHIDVINAIYETLVTPLQLGPWLNSW